jgi:hypothetical protein
MNKILYLLLAVVCWSCTHNSETEKYQSKRKNVINVRDKIREIQIDDVHISSLAAVYAINDYLIIQDFKSYDNFVHVFDKNSFSHVISAIPRGQGPYEITNPGPIVFDEVRRKFYFTDFGKYKIFSYDLDSLLTDPSYKPAVKANLDTQKIPERYVYINDTLCISIIIEPVSNSDFKQALARWNMQTGKIKLMEYVHPDIKGKPYFSFDVSMEHGLYIICYHDQDLITVCDLDGNLKYNIYGPKWDSKKTGKTYLENALFCGDKFITAYNGENVFVESERGIETGKPTKFLVINLHGDYIQTLETEYRIGSFCYDKENHRIVMSMYDEIQFAYLELDGLLE